MNICTFKERSKLKKKVLTALILFAVLITFISCETGNSTENSTGTSTDNGRNPLPATSISPSPYPSPTANTEQIKNAPLRFVVMADSRGSDMGINTKVVEKTLESIKKILPQPLFAVMPGDLIDGASSYSNEKTQLLHFKDTITKYYPISFFYPGFGNHEATAGAKGEQAFNEVFSEFNANFLEGYNKTVYYFDKNDTRLYMLNSNHIGESHIISDTQLNWIKANTDLGKKHNMYFFHEPAYPTGAHVGSSLDVNKLQRDKLWGIVDNSVGSMVFCGHEHNYTRRHINSDFNETINDQTFKFNKSVYQITTGTFGAPFYKDFTEKKDVDVPPIVEYHFAIVDIDDNNIQVTVYNLDGKVIDYFNQ